MSKDLKQISIAGNSIPKPTPEQTAAARDKEVAEYNKKLESLERKTEKTVYDRLDIRELKVKIEATKKGEKLETHEHFWDDGYKFYYMDKLTDYGKIQKIRQALATSGFKKLIETKRFDNFEIKHEHQQIMVDKAKGYIKNPKGWFAFMGQTGLGKTHISTAMATELMLRGNDVEYMVWVDEVEKIKYADYDEKQKIIEKYLRAEVLYIDDLFKKEYGATPTSADLDIAIRIINHRYNNEKRTIISTELHPDELKELDGNLHGRIREMCKKFGTDNFVGFSYRENGNYRETF